MFELDNSKDIDISQYSSDAKQHEYIEELSRIDAKDSEEFLKVGVDTMGNGRAGTFIQKDSSVIHCKASQPGVEVMSISNAKEKYSWLQDYLWKAVPPDKDKFTKYAKNNKEQGYFIHTLPGAKVEFPVQACLHIESERFSQNVHNVLIAEEGSEVHIITGCSTSSHLTSGLHIGVSEFYIKKGATVKFTMVHDWGKQVNVRPRTVSYVEEGGVLISNYICLKPVGSLQMNPVTYLNGKGAIARFHSILVASGKSYMDIGSKVVLNAPDTRAEIISRAITTGGTIIARGDLVGKYPGVKAHLECKGLILNEGLLHAIPELQGHVPGVEMSHEAAVGKIDRREIEYLMARGLNEEEAVSTIVRGFLNVDIEGLPASLVEKLDKAIAETQDDMM